MLETAICVHTAKPTARSLELTANCHDDCSKLQRWKDKSWESMWALSSIRHNDSFWVGHQGRLVATRCLIDCILEPKAYPLSEISRANFWDIRWRIAKATGSTQRNKMKFQLPDLFLCAYCPNSRIANGRMNGVQKFPRQRSGILRTQS